MGCTWPRVHAEGMKMGLCATEETGIIRIGLLYLNWQVQEGEGEKTQHCILRNSWRGKQKCGCYAQRLGVSTKCFSNNNEGMSVPRQDHNGQVGSPRVDCHM